MKISVFITSYNQREYLKEAIESVLAQTLAPVQVVVVDDASSDGSQDLIADYRSRYPAIVVPIYHQRNTGVAQTRIDALCAVVGDYVSYVDGDDLFVPEKLEKEAAALKAHNEVQIAFSNNVYVSPDGNTKLRRWVNNETVPQGDVFWHTFTRSFPNRSLFRMELVDYAAWKRIGFHDPNLRLYEDFDMRIRLTKRLRAVYVDEPLSYIRAHNFGLSSAPINDHFTALDYLYKKNLPLLDDIAADRRTAAIRMFKTWIAPQARAAGWQALKQGQLLSALRFSGRSCL